MTTQADRVVLAEYLDEVRLLVTDEIERLFGEDDEQQQALYDLILDYPLREGKALRPALAIATCLSLGGYLEAILPTAATLELYHNAFLVHDDVEDGSLQRRGRPTLHVDHGVPIAINVGDAMLVLCLRPLLANTELIGLGPALKVLRAVARMTQESVEGQAKELSWVRANRWDLTDADYLAMVVQKTGWYSFVTPMQVGAIVAGAPQTRIDAFEPFARNLSVAFQITDDILNLEAEGGLYGKEIGGDLWEGKRTLILLHAVRTAPERDAGRAIAILGRSRPPAGRETAVADLLDTLEGAGDLTPAGRAALEAASPWQGPFKTPADISWLRGLIDRQGSIEYAAMVAGRYATAASRWLRTQDWIPRSRHREVLEDLVRYVHERTR